MKVLMLGWELPPHNSGGLGVACYQLCKALAALDIDIEFILPYRADHNIDFMNITAASPYDVAELKLGGFAYDSHRYVFEDGHVEWLDIAGQQRLYEEAVAKLVMKREYDIIHAHDWLTFRAGLRAREYSNCPLVLHVHSIERDRAGGNAGNPLVREIEATSFLLADRIVAVSGHTKQLIVEDYGIPADKIEVVHNSIDQADMEPLDSDNAYRYLSAMKAQGWHVVSNVGRMTIQKGLANLLYAAKEVVYREPKTIFLLVGSGEQYYELIQLAAHLGISKNVVFAGFQRGKNWRDSFAIADLFVMPSVSEPFGLTTLEAIGYGAPVLISKQSGVSEVLKSCLKVNAGNVGEMANQITAAVQNDSLRGELHHNAYREFMRLSWADSAEKMTRIYDRQLARAMV